MKLHDQSKANTLLDLVIRQQALKNDAALCRKLDMSPPIISKIRHGKYPVGPSIILRLHEVFGMPVADIRTVLS